MATLPVTYSPPVSSSLTSQGARNKNEPPSAEFFTSQRARTSEPPSAEVVTLVQLFRSHTYTKNAGNGTYTR